MRWYCKVPVLAWLRCFLLELCWNCRVTNRHVRTCFSHSGKWILLTTQCRWSFGLFRRKQKERIWAPKIRTNNYLEGVGATCRASKWPWDGAVIRRLVHQFRVVQPIVWCNVTTIIWCKITNVILLFRDSTKEVYKLYAISRLTGCCNQITEVMMQYWKPH